MPQKREQLLAAAWGDGRVERLGKGRKRPSSDSESDAEENGNTNGHLPVSRIKRREPNLAYNAYTAERSRNVGIITRVRLENFMCHSLLEWEPNACVNFVTGANGSGKSSILQGLVLGLMGETKHIKRYSKISDFIKRECSKAVIQVTMKNQGEYAYKPDVYGDHLTFQRTILESGTSFFIIKDENMRDVVKKAREARDECRRILDRFSIQVDSPVVILQQDEAKELLKIESPSQLYRFFEKATLVKQILDQYKAAENEYKRAQETLKEKTKALKEVKSELMKAHAKYEEVIKSLQMNEELQQANGEFAWAKVHNVRENCQTLREKIEKVMERVEQPRAKLVEIHRNLAQMKSSKAELEISLEDETSKFSSQEQALGLLKEEVDLLKQDLKTLNDGLKAETANKNGLTQEIRVINDQLDVLARQGNAAERQKKEYQTKLILDKLERERKQIEELIAGEGEARESVEHNIRQDAEKESLITIEIKNKNEKKELLKREIEELEGASEQHLAVFGTKIPLVNKAIKRYLTKFKKVPVGPVGAHVKLKDEAATNSDLARLVETELSRAQLTAYLVNDDDDRRTLNKILTEVYGTDRHKPRIFTSKFLYRPHNVNRAKCQEPVIMDYIQVDNVVVFNHLVDQKSIESVIVCKTQDIAKSLMTRHENVPANCSYAITHDLYRFFPPRDRTSYRSYYMEQLTGSGMLRATMSNLVQERNNELAGLTQHILELNAEKETIVRSRQSYEAEKKRAMSEIQQLRAKVSTINSKMTQVKSEEVSNNQDDADNLQARLVTRQTGLSVAEEKIADLMSEKERINEQLKLKQALFKTNRESLNELKSTANPILKELRELDNKISLKNKEMLNQEKSIKRIYNELEQLKLTLKKNEEEEETFLAAAVQCSDKELHPDKTIKQLQAKITQLKKKIALQSDDGTSKAEESQRFRQEYLESKAKYDEMKSTIESLCGMLNTINSQQREREANFGMLRNLLSMSVRRKFNKMIQMFSKQTGSDIFLRIDNDRKELKFTYKSKADGGSRSSLDIASLSGGEKSFTQMCLICSLWEVMQPPFRCLDEWDVYLDSVNRKAITGELLKFSLVNLNKQFIFISPQGACDLADVDHGVVSVTEIKKS